MSGRAPISRRRFLVVSLGSTAGLAALLAACGQQPPAPEAKPPAPTSAAKPAEAAKPAADAKPAAPAQVAPASAAKPATVPTPASFQESPVLAELVKQGKLPPLKERLPEEPLVIDRKGKYGGTLRTVNGGTSIFPPPVRYAGGIQGTPLRISPDLQGYVPNLAKKVEYSSDFKTLTLTMRKGVRWSDGQPHTADDWVFWYEDVLKNRELTPVPNPWFMVGGKLMNLVKVDDYTVRFEFAASNPAFALVNLAHIIAFPQDNALPAHYLRQFHVAHNPKAGEDAKAATLENWFQLFASKRDPEQNPEVPRLGGYVVDAVSPSGVTFKRNPYFWMVDAEGKQLPYIDQITLDRVESLDIIEPRAVSGTYDFVDRGLQIKSFKTYKDGEQKGGYRALAMKTGLGAAFLYDWNLNFPDEVWRTVFRDVRFRRAMSVAINRDEINEVLYFGLGRPAQMTAHSTSRAYKEQYAKAWAQYDPELANKLLDEMGLKLDPSTKLRQLPDGRPMQLSFEVWQPNAIHEMTAEYWRKIGVQIDFKLVLRSALAPKVQANQVMMSSWTGDEVIDTLLLRRAKWFPPYASPTTDEQTIAPLWAQWYATGGKQGEEPPPDFKQLYEWLDKYTQTNDVQYADKILAYQAENLLVVGTVADPPTPILLNKDLKNTPPETTVWGWDTLSAYAEYPEAWYFDR
jgi:peptide/nickel transport system substrate-binding protein